MRSTDLNSIARSDNYFIGSLGPPAETASDDRGAATAAPNPIEMESVEKQQWHIADKANRQMWKKCNQSSFD